ncbi:actin cytoskeleton and mitosis protein [Basidiobolus ranarum]|uniref:Actin cytoskeleton and mitosis protein n=1 Tax=Basidiobolus ranarum TaxID=34480 RepID=A0ABR2X003_9FUNG
MTPGKKGVVQRRKGQTPDERAARFNSVPEANRYFQLKALRPQLRSRYIAQGLLQDPTKPLRLDQAITFVGTCQDMCPEFECEEREYQKNLEKFELIPGTNKLDRKRAVKAYHRPAAGNEQPLPCDVRSPEVLTKTLDYLIENIVGADDDLEASHAFVRDRTRSIRQDFTLQNCRSLAAVSAHERIARYHILCLHQLCQNSNFSEQQEVEQLRKVLLSLQEFYEDLREDGISCPNEAEFRAYNIITHLRDTDIARQAQLYPKEIFRSSIVQLALTFHGLCQCNNTYFKRNMPPNCEASMNFFSKFLKLIKHPETPYLMACLLEWHLADIRKNALKAMNKAYLYQSPGISVSELTDILWFDEEEHTLETCQSHGLEVVSEPTLAVKFRKKDPTTKRLVFYEVNPPPKQTKSFRLVESKRNKISNVDIVNGIKQLPDITNSSTVSRDRSLTELSNDLTLSKSHKTPTRRKKRKQRKASISAA